MRRRFAAALLLAGTTAMADAPPGFRVDAQMRDTGYVLGDLLRQRVDVSVPDGVELAPASLPGPGLVMPWLELRACHVERRDGGYRITLDYQVFGAVESARSLEVPAFVVRWKSGAPPLTVAPQPFRLSPVLPAQLDEQARQPRPALVPEPFDEREPLQRAGILLAAAAAIALWLAWLHDRLAFLPRHPGPLTRLWRHLRWRRRQAGEDYPALLRQLHGAFNACAKETLYSDNLSVLYARAPHLETLRLEIDAFFEHSRTLFYGDGTADGAWNASRVIALCRRARDCERGLE